MPGPPPPSAPRRPHQLTAHGHRRVDDWFWLRDAEDPEVISHLQAENDYAERLLAPTADLQEELFEEIRSRVRETDAGPPAHSGGWWYYTRTEEGRQYPVMCRRPDPGRRLAAAQVAAQARDGRPDGETVVLDENALAGDGDYLALGVFDVSPDHSTLAYAVDLDGSEEYTLRFRDLATGSDHPDQVERVYYGSAWAADSGHLFYVRPDDAMRPWQVWCHRLGTSPVDDRLVFQEDDERFFVDIELSRTEKRIVIHSASKTSSEARWLDATDPGGEAKVVLTRQPEVEYDVEHDGDGWWIRTNHLPGRSGPATNFALLRFSGDDPAAGSGPEVVLDHRPEIKVDSVEAFAAFTIVTERSAADGLERIRVIGRDGAQHVVDQPEAAYTLLGGQNPEWDQDTYRFGYTSLVTPRTSVDYHVSSRRREAIWSQDVSGYDPGRYRTERLWATAPDGARVPVSLVCRADHTLDGRAAGLLYGYGAYEASMDPAFSVLNLNLVERGMVFAIAHVRGGGELGRAWYEQGRMENKANTFTDFIAVAETLVADGWVDRDRLATRGGSAGGLLMGAVTNLRPELWRAVVAEVPFVDVVTTMSDTTLPLTVTEWEEWGDPVHDPDAYHRMLGYSPYDNVSPGGRWPAMYVTAGLHDPRVGFWEPAKWVCRLRAAGAGGAGRPVLLRTEMGAGHQGPSGRYDTWRDEARVQAFLLTQTATA